MDFVDVELDGMVWEVASAYFPHVTIGEAAELAEANGCELPSPRLADAIWLAADLRLEPLPRKHDGTLRTMSSPAVYEDQERLIAEQVGGLEYTLAAGCYKDVVRLSNGVLGLYGWHVDEVNAADWNKRRGIPLLRPATANLGALVIQPVFTGHSKAWGDYSQGARLCRKKF